MAYILFMLGTVILLTALVLGEIAVLRFVARKAGVTRDQLEADEPGPPPAAPSAMRDLEVRAPSTEWRHHQRARERERRQSRV